VNEDLIQKIRTFSEKPLKDLGISIYHLEFVKEGGENFLRYYIDKEDGGVDLDVCVEVSRVVSSLLDKLDPITSPYTLEVSSSGAEKPLITAEHFIAALNKNVHFDLNEIVDGKSEYEGKLININEDSYELEVKIKTITKKLTIKKSTVGYARLAVTF
jgi:ribosome maturation factor RimP